MPAHAATGLAKPRLVIVLGAGASADVVPTAAQLTQCALEYEDHLIAPIADGVRARCRNASFEDILEACRQRLASPSRPRVDGDLGTSVETYFRGIIRSITSRLQSHDESGRQAAQTRLLKALAEEFAVTVASLNWDDLAWDPSDPWYSGFGTGHLDVDYATRASDPWAHRLLWLHGSLHFRVQVANLPPRLEWLPDRQQIERATLLAQVDGELAGPLITGRNKDGQLWRSPFFDYRYVLYRDLLRASAVVIVGYSGVDADLNNILRAGVSTGSPSTLMRIDVKPDKPWTVGRELEWWRSRFGSKVRFVPPLGQARPIETCDLVSVTTPVVGCPRHPHYLSLGGCEWAANHIDEVLMALTTA